MATSQTTTYPKDLVVQRIKTAIDGLPELERAETAAVLEECDQFIDKLGEFADTQLQERIDTVLRLWDTFANLASDVTWEEKFDAAQRLKNAIDQVDYSVPYAPYRNRDKLIAIKTKYVKEKQRLEAKLAFIEGADAPAGFTLTALRDFDLIKYLR